MVLFELYSHILRYCCWPCFMFYFLHVKHAVMLSPTIWEYGSHYQNVNGKIMQMSLILISAGHLLTLFHLAPGQNDTTKSSSQLTHRKLDLQVDRAWKGGNHVILDVMSLILAKERKSSTFPIVHSKRHRTFKHRHAFYERGCPSFSFLSFSFPYSFLASVWSW